MAVLYRTRKLDSTQPTQRQADSTNSYAFIVRPGHGKSHILPARPRGRKKIVEVKAREPNVVWGDYYNLAITNPPRVKMNDISLSSKAGGGPRVTHANLLGAVRFALSSTTPTIKFLSASKHGANAERAWIHKALEQVAKLKELAPNWNGHDSAPPNPTALYWSEEVLRQLYDLGIKPTRIVPSADEGISILFLRGPKYVNIECFNMGQVAVLLKNRTTSWQGTLSLPTDESSMRQHLELIDSFLTRGAFSAVPTPPQSAG
jgi:hypothetical protein